jgi:hypothetical protein
MPASTVFVTITADASPTGAKTEAPATTAVVPGNTNNVGTSPDGGAAGGADESSCLPDVVITETASETASVVTVDKTATVVPFPAGNGTETGVASSGLATPTGDVKVRFAPAPGRH